MESIPFSLSAALPNNSARILDGLIDRRSQAGEFFIGTKPIVKILIRRTVA
jgi:hypothetical protein